MKEQAESFVVQALGTTVRWTVPRSVVTWLRDEVFRTLVAREATADMAEHEVVLTHDAGGWRAAADGDHVSGPTAADCLPEVFIALNRVAAASMVQHHLVLHAGAVAVDTPTGSRVLAMCGVSGSGKSTATAAATLRGHAYVADEVCAIDLTTSLVQPYLRPIGLRVAGGAAIGVTAEMPSDVGGAPTRAWHPPAHVDGPVRLGLVALVDRRPGDVIIHDLRPAEALEELVQHMLAADGRERVMFRRAEQLVRSTNVVRVSYEDVFAAVDALAERVRS